jgi:hypothetical protein
MFLQIRTNENAKKRELAFGMFDGIFQISIDQDATLQREPDLRHLHRLSPTPLRLLGYLRSTLDPLELGRFGGPTPASVSPH